jgi:integrase
VGQVEDTVGAGVYVSMDRVVRRNAAGEFVIVHEGKGQASVRRVKIDEGAAAMFRRRVVGKSLGDLVFTTASGEQLHYSNFRRDAWDPAVKAANLSRRPTPHWLRHTHVVWMALTGASLPELQSRIGHASITTTINVYGRMLNDVSDRALDGFAAMRDAPLDAQIEG